MEIGNYKSAGKKKIKQPQMYRDLDIKIYKELKEKCNFKSKMRL